MPNADTALGRTGRWFTDANGRVVTLHGVNMVNKLPPYHPAALGFGEQDAALIARWGFNTIRVGWIWKALEPEPGRYDFEYLERIASLVRMLASHGLHVLVDFHQDMLNERFSGEGFPDWAVLDDGLPHRPDLGFPRNYFFMPGLWRAYDNFWNNAPGPDRVGLQERFAKAWRLVAERLQNEPRVFYDIFNEPFPGSAAPLCAQPFGYARFDRKLSALNWRALAAIREVEPTKLVLYEPNVLFNNGSRTHHAPLGDEGTGLSFHNYCWATTPGMPRLRGRLQPLVCARAEQRVITNARAHAASAGATLMMTEFGCTDDLDNIERVCAIADQNMVSWQYWAYYNEDPSSERPEENLIRDLSLPREPPNLHVAKLETLSRPYPRAVAGTPLAFEFDPRRSAFTLSYETRLPSSAAPTDRRTEILVPEHSFGDDFDVEVSGGTVEATDSAAQLVWIMAAEGVARVDVRISAR
jgi:endoglycosylceramidase